MFGGGGDKEALKNQLLNGAPAKTPARTLSKEDRMGDYIDAMADKAGSFSPKCAAFLHTFKPFVTCFMKFLSCVVPLYVKLYNLVYKVLSYLPHNVLMMLFGICLCFFGGVYIASIAAIEAFRNMGGQQLYTDIAYIRDEVVKVMAAREDDAKVDNDKDGIADRDQMTGSELAEHDIKLAMVAVKDPDKLQSAVGSLWSAYIAVLATLRLQFARTIAIALGVCELIKFPVVRVFAPVLTYLMGPDLKHWVNTTIDVSIKFFAMMFAWYLQAYISAFYSGLRGASLFATGLFNILAAHGLLEKLPFVKKPFNPDESYLDEIIGFPLAAVGMYWQFKSQFGLPFWAHIPLFPLDIVEYWLEFQITWGSTALPLQA
eukprot:TRINITY_DN29615_c0_g1_i1.p2 TRINITY_DN29615_c0_g1~~TRINITY_DN29615_c0_g1_i1.p2  ORF type:complete len:388 (-),score=102.35 TRINITY_DN29615_c0_g1_i1:229-1347(-)